MTQQKSEQLINVEEIFLLRLAGAFGTRTKPGQEKMKKNILENPSKETMDSFLRQENFIEAIYAFSTGTDLVNLLSEAPSIDKYKRKSFIILRIGKNELTEETAKQNIIFMEVTKNILEHMYNFCSEVLGPVMQNPDNQQGWTDLVTKDLMQRFNNFVAQNYVMIGLSKGMTLLPLPSKKIINSEGPEKDKAHIFQGCIITWTKQIKNVLKLEPEQALKNEKNPGPKVQLDFWENKANNLNSIYSQLQSIQVKGILRFLERSKSTYTNPFTKLQRQVLQARVEANDNTKFLSTLKDLFNQLYDDTSEFHCLHELFPPIMHTFLKIYQLSNYYNTPPRLVVLIKETCNEVIARASEYINGNAVASALSTGSDDITEVCKKLQTTIDICSRFKEYYFQYKNKSDGKWKLTLNALFSRLDAYSERCHDILHLTTTIMQFNKLEKIQLGGTKGKNLTETLKQISEQFKKAVDNFRQLPYDTMDINQKKFDDDFMIFRHKIKELERRLASVVTQGFDDNDTIMGKFKLLDCFEGILNRAIIQDQLEKKHAVLLDMYKQDLKCIQTIFLEGKILIDQNDERSPIYNNYPLVAGTLTWCKTLKDRIAEPFRKLDSLGKGIIERQEYKDVQKLYNNIIKIITDYQESKFIFWEKQVDESVHQKLKHSLFCKDESAENKQNGLLKVNFDPILVRLLRQVKYLKQLNSQVPETAEKLYQKAQIYRRQVVSLELIIQNYNKIITCLNDVQQPLVKKRIVKMDEEIEPGITKYRWQSPEIDGFINKSKDVVDSLYEIVDKMKKSLDNINNELAKLKKPMIQRKNKPISPEEYDNILKAVIANKLTGVKECGTIIHKLLKQINDAVKFDKKQPEWKKYTEYINTIVTDGICQAIVFALDHLNDQVNSMKSQQPQLFQIKLQLQGKKGIVYDPEIDVGDPGNRSVCQTLKGWINEIFSIAHNFPRLDATTSQSGGGSSGDYLIQIRANFMVKFSISKISNNLNLIVKNTENVKNDLKKYKYLWQQQPEDSFSKFLTQNEPKIQRQQGDNNLKKQNILLKGCRETIPNLDLFDQKITSLKQIQLQVAKIQTPVEKAWIKIDLRNFIKALEVKINSWIKIYTEFLTTQFKTTLKNLKDFNSRTNTGLKKNPKEVFENTEAISQRQKQKNRALLMKVMKHISEMKSVKGQITTVIQRMRNMVIKLKKHGVHVSEKGQEEPLQSIEASQGGFNETEKKVNQIKKDIINIIGDEAIQVKKKLDSFGVKVNQFKNDFKANLPYQYQQAISTDQIMKSYQKIDEYYLKLLKFQQQAKQNAQLEDLFQLEQRNYKPLKQCLSDLKNLKSLWDLIALVNLQYNDWKNKLWRQIKADLLIEQNKTFITQIKNVSKEVRFIKGWQIIQKKIQNMNVVLNLVQSLRGDYMQDRHWKQLKDKTKTDFDHKSSNFSFDDILKLKLYNLKAQVEQIVDIAQKEFKIDKKLRIIEANWAKQIFQFDMYKQNYIFAPLDDMMQILDANSLDLMGMKAQGKYVQFFIEIVQDWRQKLGRVDVVVNEWLKVQKNWRILVNIFVGSDDIRQQLPQDTKVFETVHGQFTEMMIAAHQNPLIIEACTEGRKTSLIQMSQKIKKCQKALNDYLQQKKKIFPRFYFLSNQSLLTILSNGQNPPKVCQFIGDCFDGLKTLKFQPPKNPGQISRIADGMYSKDDEQIHFPINFVAQGQVELWLKQLEFKMRVTLYDILSDAKGTSDTWDTGTDKPRQQWIKDYCAQVALLTTNIVWTEDVNRAFEELSSGAESAMKECVEIIKTRITKLINKVTKPLQILQRMKVINIITIDVHGRDVVQNFVNTKVMEAESFPWQSQLKFEWSTDKNNEVGSKQFSRFPWESDSKKFKCIIRIVDWFRFYSYQYVGNTLRLVITPLTDRCYITLTQALNLVMGGAPAGPAGTGKTETTKDLGRAIGLPVIVFNCSDQMGKDSMAQIFMGLCQSGAWGCFDQFNRISVEVLSVISTQVKTCLDAQKQKKKKFVFMEEGQINLEDTAGFFITMNPGYAGRAQLPDNLKALFRSCAMVVPDLVLICENMLMSEGFVLAKDLSKKFVALYMLSRQLLSKQKHYDWGLRAVKSVLRQAGKLKRDPDNEKMHEDPLLMRALRDFNLPKIVTDDKPIFIRLIQDLFPNAKAQDKKPSHLTKICDKTTKTDMGLYYEEQFVKKCIDLSDILEVRHCVFIIGPAGCGKTTVWKTLLQTHKNNNEDGEVDTLNPKAVSVDQLFGHYTKSKQWRNGVLSVILKNQNKCQQKYKKSHVHKWTVLDGDVDTLWIESLNTVMDDNKVLTLVSNDRIPLSASMRLLFEVSNLKNASPATVSRGGVLFINEIDIGWSPFVNSWLERSQPYMKSNDDGISLTYAPINEVAKAVFFRCFQSYIQTPSDMHDQTKITYLAPPSTMGFINTICMILDGLLLDHDKQVISLYGSKQKEEEQQKVVYEAFFIFATMWAYGGSVGGGQDDNEILNKFNGVFRSLVKIKFPQGGLVYDYFWNVEQNKWSSWTSKIRQYEHIDEPIFSKIFVSTIHTSRLRYLLDMHLKRKKPALFVGGGGTGKTQVIKDYLSTTRTDQVAYKTINFSSFTDAQSLQRDIQSMLDKKSGKTYGSAMNKTLIAFIDDLNMPYVEKYGTQTPIQLLRQIIDYGSIFNREQLEQKKFIQDLLFFSCLNHKSGSFTVDLRLQRNFSSFTMYTPTDQIIKRIFGQILTCHLAQPGFEEKLKLFSHKIMDATVQFFTKTIRNPQFSPSAKKFHYQFNFRQLSKITEGLLRSNPQTYKNPNSITRLWLHEVRRVFEDRFVNDEDLNLFRSILKDAISKNLGDFNEKDTPFTEPIIFTKFMTDFYQSNDDITELRRIMKQKLDDYNDLKAQMNLVLFDQAIQHVCRIARMIQLPSGHALLVGVGGSGKQSLARLATFIVGFELQQMVVTQSFGMNDLRTYLSQMYRKIAKPNSSVRCYMVTDSQIKLQSFLIPINDMLNSGWISDLFPKEDFDAMISNIRNQAKGNGVADNIDAMLNYFYDRMKKQLKLILCFSPVGQTMRIRARKFPGIINSTAIDWFHPWPRDALIDVAYKFLQQTELDNDQIREKIAVNMAQAHLSIDSANQKFRKFQRRNNYTTPKSFLQLISFYKTSLDDKKGQVQKQIKRYTLGLQILDDTKSKVMGLQEELKIKMVEVEKQRGETDILIQKVSTESAIAEEEQAKANEEEIKTNAQKDAAQKLAAECKVALQKAEPALKQAEEAVKCLKKNHIGEMKAFTSPPGGVVTTCRVVLALLKQKLSSNDPDEKVWKKAQSLMNQPEKFLERVLNFDGTQIDGNILDVANKIIEDPSKKYTEKDMVGQSFAASKLCAWSVNIVTFNRIFKQVRPLQIAKDKALEELEAAMKDLAKVKQQVRKLNEMVDGLREKLNAAETLKKQVEEDAERCSNKLTAAEKLVNGLAGENKRWSENVVFLKENIKSVIGDVLLASQFVSYIGAFSSRLRQQLWQTIWLPNIISKAIPMTEGMQPLKILTSESIKARWKNQGLPSDTMSFQNASIISSCSRWPLLIDPQLQGSNWIRGSQGDNLSPININQKHWMRQLTKNISDGRAVLLEGIQEEIQATLDPLLSRAIVKKAGSYSLELGSQVIDYDPKFKLYLMTKLTNPHFRPQIAAQCTIINFIVTESGLEEQLLAMVVNIQKNQLQVKKQELVKKQNEFKVILDDLQSSLLKQLSDANPATILDNKELIDNLQKTKATAISIQQQSEIAKVTQTDINAQRQIYRSVAAEGAMLYFLCISLCIIDHMYQYSLESFIKFFFKAIQRTQQKDQTRTLRLIENIRYTIYQWVSRGLFQKHKLIFLSMITFRLMNKKVIEVNYSLQEMDFLIRGIPKIAAQNTLDWLPDTAWNMVQALSQLDEFKLFAQNMEKDAPTRFKDWYNQLTPEDVKLPMQWKKLDATPFKKLLVLRCLRPDRITVALSRFIKDTLPKGDQFIQMDSKSSFLQILGSVIADSEPQIPIFFILSPGSDPVKQVEKIIKLNRDKYRIQAGKSFFSISLGQGQDEVSRRRIQQGNKEGHWVMLQNIHLMPRWLIELQKILDSFSGDTGSHVNFRLLLSAEPSDGIPIGILDRSIKLTNEPPSGIKANMKRAFTYFPKQQVDEKDSKVKCILFGLCFFHSTVIERKRFGPLGWNMGYPFNMGDLRDSYLVLNRYMESASGSSKIPFEDLIYIFGEIMYGGHIVDDWDRRLAKGYLENVMSSAIFEQEQLFPYIQGKNISFRVPLPTTYEKYMEHIETLGSETPLAYGLHPNSQISFRTTQCTQLFSTLLQIAPKDSSGGGQTGGKTLQDLLQDIVRRFLEDIGIKSMIFSVDQIKNKMDADQKGPYQNVFIQQIEYMTILLTQIARSIEQIDQGIKGLLTISQQMQQTMDALLLNKVPTSWSSLAYPSKRGLEGWVINLLQRIEQLNLFRDDPLTLPKVIMISRFFNPQSYLTAIKQVVAAYQRGLQLNKLYIQTDITKKTIEQIDINPKDGAFCYGFILEGARWDTASGYVEESKPKEMFSVIPVVYCKAQSLPPEGKEDKALYQCPAYKTQDRSATYVFTAQLKTRQPPRKWILAGVAIIMDVQGLSDETKKKQKKQK